MGRLFSRKTLMVVQQLWIGFAWGLTYCLLEYVLSTRLRVFTF